MSKKLQYFDVNGLGEPIRYLLHYAKQKFDDVRYDVKTWPVKKVKDSLPYGRMPLYEEAGRALHQSVAIARYIASQYSLLPADPWDQAVLDAVVFTIYDFWTEVVEKYVKEEDPIKKQKQKKLILEETIDFFYTRFEKELKVNKGYLGKQLTWADFILVGITEAASLYLGEEFHKKYPTVDALMQKVWALPGVKEYIATRKPYTV